MIQINKNYGDMLKIIKNMSFYTIFGICFYILKIFHFI